MKWKLCDLQKAGATFRLTMPAPMVRSLGWKRGDLIEVSTEPPDTVRLQKVIPVPATTHARDKRP